jgi:hypothetical protein
MFYHNATRYDSFEAAASAAAIAARDGAVQVVERGSDHKVWTGFFRRYDPEFLARTAQVPATAPEIVPAVVPAMTDLLAIVEALRAEVASLKAEKSAKGRKTRAAQEVPQHLPDDPLPPM